MNILIKYDHRGWQVFLDSSDLGTYIPATDNDVFEIRELNSPSLQKVLRLIDDEGNLGSRYDAYGYDAADFARKISCELINLTNMSDVFRKLPVFFEIPQMYADELSVKKTRFPINEWLDLFPIGKEGPSQATPLQPGDEDHRLGPTRQIVGASLATAQASFPQSFVQLGA